MVSKNVLIENLITLFTFCYIANVILCQTIQEDPCPARILPTDEINLEENDTLLVYCQLTNVTPQCNSQHLSFDSDTREFTRIINESTIELRIPNAPAMEKYIICKYNNDTGLMPFSVQVGHKPSKVKLECISKNFEGLSCRVELPPNTITVQYTAVYWPSTPTIQPIYSQITNCTEEFRINKTCTVSMFRKSWNYTFEITGTNKLGSYTQHEIFDVKRIVIPNKPVDVTTTNVTSRSANLSWSLPHNFLVFRGGDFIHRITLQIENQQIIDIDTSNVKRLSQIRFNLELTDLEYAHTWYNVQIFYRVANALYGDRQWSEHSFCVFETKGRKPDSPPEASPTAFYTLEQNETIIYWKELPLAKHNGPDLTYKIFEVIENGRIIKKEPRGPYSTTIARFDNINPYSDYEFKLIAENTLGPSENFSIIRIPSVSNRIQKPINLKKILSQSIYNLTWEYPAKRFPTKYTIFRCDPVDEQESLCDHLIDFDEIDGRETQYIYNNTIDKNPKIFAITANYNENSSGMSWFPCSATINSDMTTFPAWLEVSGPQKIKVSWSLRCDTTPLLQGFNISYCALIGDPKERKCAPDGEFHQFVPEKQNETVITNLTAYTTYLVKLYMFNGKETGPPVTLQNTTASGVPTPPINLTGKRITNNSISLEWNQPEFWNGKDQSYKIVYTTPNNQLFVRTVERVSDKYLPTNYTIDNLDSFTYYNIKIAGCNPACSNYSNEIMIKTKTGKPKQVENLLNAGDTNRPIYKWSPPKFHGGNLDFYEFKIGIKMNGKYLPNPRIIILNGTECTLRAKVCNENVQLYNVSVRAVNMVRREIPLKDSYYSRNHYDYGHIDKSPQISCVEEFNHNYYLQCNTDYDCIAGDFKEGIISECLYDSETFRFYLILFVGFSIGVGILIGVVIGMKKFHKMRDIGVELPEGLEDIDKVKPPMDNIKPDKMDNNKLDDEQTMRLIATDNKSASSFSLERKSQSSEFIDSDNEHTLNEDSVSNSPNYDKISNDNLKFDDESCSSNKNIDVIQNPQSIIQVMNPINNIPQSLPIMSNGYVSNAFLAPSSNGYVQHSALMNMNIPVASNGYTSIAALMNQNKQAGNRAEPPKQQQDNTNNIKTPIVTSTNGISGYVTHKQLSDFHNTLMQ